MTHVCVGLLDEEICDGGDIWVSCEAEVCNDPCRQVGLCPCSCHNDPSIQEGE